MYSAPPLLNLRATLAIACLLCIGLTACAMQTAQEAREKATMGVLVVQPDVDVTTSIDGGAPKTIAAEQERPFSLEPGPHRIEVEHPDYLTRRFDVEVRANEATILRVQMWPLVEELDADE